MEDKNSLVSKIEEERYLEISTEKILGEADWHFLNFHVNNIKLSSRKKIARDYTILQIITYYLSIYWNSIEKKSLTINQKEHKDSISTIITLVLQEINSPLDKNTYGPAFIAAKEYLLYQDNRNNYVNLTGMIEAVLKKSTIVITDKELRKYQLFLFGDKLSPESKIILEYKKNKYVDSYLNKCAYFAYKTYYLPKVDPRDNLSPYYQEVQKPGCESFWKKIFQSYAYRYNENLILCHPTTIKYGKYGIRWNTLNTAPSRFVAYNNKSLFSILKATPLGELLKTSYKTRTIPAIKYILRKLVYSQELQNVRIYLPPFVHMSKRLLFLDINKHFAESITSDKYFLEKENKSISEYVTKSLSLHIIFPSNYSKKDQLDASVKLVTEKFDDINNFSRLFRVLYDITDGKLETLDKLAVLFAKIFLGNNFFKCNSEFKDNSNVKECHPATVITTNNVYFVFQFFSKLFLYDLTEKTIKADDSSIVKQQEQNLPVAKDYITRVFNQDIKYMNRPSKQKNSRPYHLTFYSLKELLNKSKIGSFIEDQIYGHLLNICVDCESEEFHITSKKKKNRKANNHLKKLINGDVVNYSHPILGKQTYQSNNNFLFIQKYISDSSEGPFDYSKMNIIELSQKLPSRCYLFDEKEDFYAWEKSFMTLNFVRYGFQLLINQNNTTEIVTSTASEEAKIPDLNDEKTVVEFIKRCCIPVPNALGETPSEKNATYLMTLNAAYLLFYNSFTGLNIEWSSIRKKWDKNIINLFGKYKNECKTEGKQCKKTALFDRDKENGYVYDEITTEKSELPKRGINANVCIGLIVKARKEVIDEGIDYKAELDKKRNANVEPSPCVSLDTFVEHLTKIAQNIDKQERINLYQYINF